MAIGWVKWCSERRHYGFILSEQGEEVFVHQTAIREADWPLRDGDEVIFTVRETPKGLQAADVIRIADADGARFRAIYGQDRVPHLGGAPGLAPTRDVGSGEDSVG